MPSLEALEHQGFANRVTNVCKDLRLGRAAVQQVRFVQRMGVVIPQFQKYPNFVWVNQGLQILQEIDLEILVPVQTDSLLNEAGDLSLKSDETIWNFRRETSWCERVPLPRHRPNIRSLFHLNHDHHNRFGSFHPRFTVLDLPNDMTHTGSIIGHM